MEIKKYLKFVPVVLFIVTVLTTPVLARMGSGHSGGGMGSGRNTDGYRGMTRVDRKTDSRWNRQATSDIENHTYESMMLLTAGSIENGGVRMELKPYSFNGGVFLMKFYAETRTGSLSDYEIMESLHLEYREMEYTPVFLDRINGQHAEGEIEFHLPEAPDHFRIVVSGLPSMEGHVFEW